MGNSIASLCIIQYKSSKKKMEEAKVSFLYSHCTEPSVILTNIYYLRCYTQQFKSENKQQIGVEFSELWIDLIFCVLTFS